MVQKSHTIEDVEAHGHNLHQRDSEEVQMVVAVGVVDLDLDIHSRQAQAHRDSDNQSVEDYKDRIHSHQAGTRPYFPFVSFVGCFRS